MGIFGSFSSKSTKNAAATAAKAIETGRVMGTADLDQGYATAADQYGKAGALFGNLTDGFGAGSKLYADALGVNGEGGSDRARETFKSGAGFTFNMDQGLQGLSRARAVNGTLASGNADTDAMKFASGLASQDWNNWLQNLSGYDAKNLAATTGEASTFGQLGSLGYQTGAAKAGLDTSAANGVGQGAYKIGEAQQKADANSFQALMGGLNLVAGGAGKAFSMFGG